MPRRFCDVCPENGRFVQMLNISNMNVFLLSWDKTKFLCKTFLLFQCQFLVRNYYEYDRRNRYLPANYLYQDNAYNPHSALRKTIVIIK
jgi:hypothetical protein